MDKKTVFVRTDKGESEAQGLTDELFGDLKRIFNLVDDESTVAEITKRAPPSLRSSLEDSLQELVSGGYIRDIAAPEVKEVSKSSVKIAAPAFKMATPKSQPAAPQPAVSEPPSPPARTEPAKQSFAMPEMPAPKAEATPSRPESAPASGKNDLDFSFIMSGNSPTPSGAEIEKSAAVARAKAEAESKAKAEAQARAAAQAKAAQAVAERDAAKKQAYEAAKVKAQIEVAARAQIEAEARAKKEAEAARQKAEQEAMKARMESEAAKAKIEAEVRARLEAEAKVKREAEAAKAKVEAEVRARLEAEAKIKREAEAIRLKAEQEAERLKRELEEAKIKAEIELRNRLEAEARAKAEQEARLKREAEAERLRLEKERAELEAARIKAEADLKMKEEAEARVRAALDARLKSEAEAKARAEMEAQMKRDAEEKVKTEIEERVKREIEEKAKYHHPTRSEMDPGEKLRASFAQTQGRDFRTKGYTTGSFQLDAFSLVDTNKMPATKGVEPAKSTTAGGSRVKAAIEERARKKAEEERLQSEQQAQARANQESAKAQKEKEEAARAQKAQEEAEKAKREAEAKRLKAEHDAYLEKVRQEEAAAKEAAEAGQLADQQAKQWEEAQQRAQALAIAEQERMVKEAAEAARLAKQKPRGPRRKFPVGKIAGGLFVLAILAVVALPYIWPMDDYVKQMEAELSSQLKQPVHIGSMNGALVPLPKLSLHAVSVGNAEEIKVGNAELNFDLSALFAPTKSISELSLQDVTLKGDTLEQSVGWLQVAGSLEKYPVSKMSFRKVSLNVPGMSLPSVNGRAEFNTEGKFVHAQFSTEDEKAGFEMEPQDKGMKLEFNMHSGTLPYFSSIKFSDLSFTAIVVNRDIVLSDFFAHIYGGALTGKGTLDRSSGWRLQALINARNIDFSSMVPNSAMSGELAGEMNILMSGNGPAQLDKEPHFEGSFNLKNGEIGKVDVETIARFGARQGVAGHTSFTEAAGTFRADRSAVHVNLNNLATVNGKTSGVISIEPGQQLNGKLEVDLKGALGSAKVPLKLSGTQAEPVLQNGR